MGHRIRKLAFLVTVVCIMSARAALPDDVPSPSGYVNDFAGVMLLTDNPDSARHWVEQVQPSLDGPAIWMAVSSQAVVPLRPYLRSGQVDGLNGGIYGSVSLDQVANTNGPATKLWNAYTAGLIVALLIMLAGGLMNYFGFSLIRSRKGGRQ